MASRDVFTQTDHEVHDVFYYKTRAYNAEVSLAYNTGVSLVSFKIQRCANNVFPFKLVNSFAFSFRNPF